MNVDYLSGKAQAQKPPPRPSRLKMIKGLAGRFKVNLSTILSEIDGQAHGAFEDQNLKVQYENLVNETFKVIKHVDDSTYKVKPALRKEVLNLRKTLDSFSVNLKKDSDFQVTRTDKIDPCIEALINAIDGFIVLINTACDFIWNGDKFPFKVAEREKKKKFLDALVHYDQLSQKDKFAPYFWILKHLNMDQKELSPRTYGLWKKQLDEGTFHHFVQPQKKFRQ
jgi:hypothetical protein